MNSQNKKIYFQNFEFVINKNVYEPAEDSFLFAENLEVKKGERVLDMGTGSGILGILSSIKAKEVIGIDINPYAVHCAKKNAELNNVATCISFIQGDLFGPLNKKDLFDLILFNAPYLPETEEKALTWLEKAWAGGSNGRLVIDSFLSKVTYYLSFSGRILLLQSTLSDVNKTLFCFEEKNLKADILAKLPIPFFETIVLIEAKF